MDAENTQRNLRGDGTGGEFRPRISPSVSSELLDLDPLLNAKWQNTVSAAFKALSGEERKYAYRRYLAPKGIRIDAENKRLTFLGRPTIVDIKNKLDSPKLLAIAAKLEAALSALGELRDAGPYIDLLEASVSLISGEATEEDLLSIRLRRALRQAFLDALVMLTRSAPMLVPATHRGLTPGAVRDFVIEVFLKHQMLGYRFRVSPAESLVNHENAFISKKISQEACTRQCEVVATERYLYLVGPVKDFSLNPYSARRFLHEDAVLNGSSVFFNGMAIPYSSLGDEAITQHLTWTLGRIVTIERQVNAGLAALMASANKVRVDTLLPLLGGEISADGTGVGVVVASRVRAFEELLTSNVLAKLPQALAVFAKTNDDHDYLFFNLRAYFLQLVGDVREFGARFAMACDDAVEELELKLLSYLRLLEKRRDVVFSLRLREDPSVLAGARLPLLEFKRLIKEYEPQARRLMLKKAKVQKTLLMPVSKWREAVDGALGRADRHRVDLERLERDLALKKKQCLVGLIRICKRYPELTVYLEREELVAVNEALRRYALPVGSDGISQLPIVISLWEDQLAFDFDAIAKRIGVTVES